MENQHIIKMGNRENQPLSMNNSLFWSFMVLLLALQAFGPQQILAQKGQGEKNTQESKEQLKKDDTIDLEEDITMIGLFPNAAGFMDGKLYVRRKSDAASFGVFIDYTTMKDTMELKPEYKKDTLTKEARGEIDLKWLSPMRTGRDKDFFRFMLKPAFNYKGILRNIETSGYKQSPDGSTVFQNENHSTIQTGGSLKVESSLSLGTFLSTNLYYEYLPLVYNSDSGEKFSSQFPDKPIESNITNWTTGHSGNLDFNFFIPQMLRITAKYKFFLNSGSISSTASIVNGNYETKISTASSKSEINHWLEAYIYLEHQAIKNAINGATPIISVSYKLNGVEIDDSSVETTSISIGIAANFN